MELILVFVVKLEVLGTVTSENLDLAVIAGLSKPQDGSKILLDLLSTYKALVLSKAAGGLVKKGYSVVKGKVCRLNRDGVIVHVGQAGYRGGDADLKALDLVYCGRRMGQCRCGKCDGQCGSWNGCPCNACVELVGFSVVNGKAAFKPSH